MIEQCDKAILSAYEVRWGRDQGTEADQDFQVAKRSLEDYVEYLNIISENQTLLC